MPLYEYECTNCHRRIEKIQKFSDAELTVCPHCAGKLERTITAAAVSFKGGGWFKDGYGSVKPATGSGDVPPAPTSDSGTASPPTADSSKAAAAPSTASPAPASTPAPSTPSSSKT
jgi:putative FmdB family regulatory protein